MTHYRNSNSRTCQFIVAIRLPNSGGLNIKLYPSDLPVVPNLGIQTIQGGKRMAIREAIKPEVIIIFVLLIDPIISDCANRFNT